jgi:hypothetical protein
VPTRRPMPSAKPPKATDSFPHARTPRRKTINPALTASTGAQLRRSLDVRSRARDSGPQAPAALRSFHRRKVLRARGRRVYFPTINPASEQTLAQIALADNTDVDLAYAAATRAFPAWARLPRPRPRQIPLPDRPAAPGPRPRVRRCRDARWRQAHQGVARLRRAHGRGPFLLSRRLGGQAGVRVSRVRAAGSRTAWSGR